MTSASMTFGRPARLNLSRGSQWFASVPALLISALRRIDRWQLNLVQEQVPSTADDVLALAQRLEPHQPGFAADLRAAALRAKTPEQH